MDRNHSRTCQTHSRDIINILPYLVFSVRTVSYGSSFFPLRFMGRALRAWAINRRGKKLGPKLTVWTSNSVSKRYAQEADSLGLVHTTLEKFENADLFLLLGLPSTLIRHENAAFRKYFWTKNNLTTEHFENAGITIIR